MSQTHVLYYGKKSAEAYEKFKKVINNMSRDELKRILLDFVIRHHYAGSVLSGGDIKIVSEEEKPEYM